MQKTIYDFDELVYSRVTGEKGMVTTITYHSPEYWTYTVGWQDGSFGNHKEGELCDEEEARVLRVTNNEI